MSFSNKVIALQGFILNISAVRDEDLWVSILTPHKLTRLYRFYGARHSVIQIGHKVDFEEENDGRIPRLRHILHLAFPWEREMDKRYWWQQYIQLLFRHLKDTEELEDFYYLLLNRIAMHLEKQDAQRAILELHTELLKKEGRSDSIKQCLLCGRKIEESTVFVRGFLSAHPECAHGREFQISQAWRFLHESDATQISDEGIQKLWRVLLLGI